MRSQISARIIKNTMIATQIYEMVLWAPELAKKARPGQFMNLYTGRADQLLPRPISICDVDADTVRILYQVKGGGTQHMAGLLPGEAIMVLGPLGNGFSLEDAGNRPILIGGGIGIPPLLFLSKQFTDARIFLGAKQAPVLADEFRALGHEVLVAAEDGSVGSARYIMDLLNNRSEDTGMVFACGPRPMLRAVYDWAEEQGLAAQLSMEERMACGIGVCVGCAIPVQKAGEADWHYQKVCKDGPVFWGNEVVWDV